MEHKRITCPETGNVEDVEIEHTDAGIIVTGCSRFDGSDPDCARECAKHLDTRERLENDDWAERVLVTYANSEDGRTRVIAEVLADDLRRDGLIVEVSDARIAPPAQDYDAVVIGSGIRFGRPARPAVRYIEENRDALAAMPAFWFSVSDAPAVSGSSDPGGCIRQLSRKTRWQPTDSMTFGAPDEEALLRRILTSLTRRREDAAQWKDVHDFALRIAEQIPAEQLQKLAL